MCPDSLKLIVKNLLPVTSHPLLGRGMARKESYRASQLLYTHNLLIIVYYKLFYFYVSRLLQGEIIFVAIIEGWLYKVVLPLLRHRLYRTEVHILHSTIYGHTTRQFLLQKWELLKKGLAVCCRGGRLNFLMEPLHNNMAKEDIHIDIQAGPSMMCF